MFHRQLFVHFSLLTNRIPDVSFHLLKMHYFQFVAAELMQQKFLLEAAVQHRNAWFSKASKSAQRLNKIIALFSGQTCTNFFEWACLEKLKR